MKKRIKEYIYKTDIIVYCMICASVFVFGLMYAVIETKYIALLLSIVCTYMICRQRYVALDLELLFLLEFIMLPIAYECYLLPKLYLWRSNAYYAIAIPLVYLLGKLIVTIDVEHRYKYIAIVLICLAVGMFVQGILDYSVNYTSGAYDTEVWDAFWAREEYSRCFFEFDFIPVTASAFLFIIYINRKKMISAIIAVALIIALYLAIRWQGRMNLGMFFINIFVLVVLYIIDIYNCENHPPYKNLIYFAIGTVFLALLLVIAYKNDFMGINYKYHHTYLAGSGGIIHNERFAAIREGIELTLKNPLGGWAGTVIESQTPHNMALEIARQYNIVPFVFLEIFKLLSIIDCIKIALDRKIKREIKYYLIILLVDFYMYYMLDPNAAFRRYYFMPAVLIVGIIKSLMEQNNNIKTV